MPARNLIVRGCRQPWLLDKTQRWRWRYWRLWGGPCFAPSDPRQTYTYAFQRLSKMERAVFALSRFQSMEYPDIARTLGISTAAVECQLVGAFSQEKAASSISSITRDSHTRMHQGQLSNSLGAGDDS